MRKNALSDRILLSIENPARYIGCELNSTVKDKAQVDIRYAMCFPDVYEIGMSNLGLQIIYDQLNRRDDIWCERVCSPWTDLHRIMKENNIPLFALESQDPVKDFDFLGITLSYELCYVNVLQVLDLSQIPRYSCDRGDDDPIVMGGGPCTYNPEPMAAFFDLFYIGESETSMYALMDLYKEHRKRGFRREEFLRQSSHIPGIYVPSLYEVTYRDDGTIERMAPLFEDVPSVVIKQVEINMSDTFYPERPVVPFTKAVQDRVTLEVMRGCIRGCRFCQAGVTYRPARERSLAFLKDIVTKNLKNTGYDEVSLSSLSTSDYSELKDLIDFLLEESRRSKVNISLPSLRIDAFSLDVMSKVQNVKKSSLTFAPEAGSQRLRDIINKGITEEDILNGSHEAFKGGWNKVKLYFMLGLPLEEDSDRKDIAHLAEKISEVYYDIPKQERNGKCQITVSTSFFVSKPFTPFQWAGMFRKEDYNSFAAAVSSEIRAQKNQKSIRYMWHETDATCLEGVFARGDRKISEAIAYAYDHGALFEAWNDFFNYDIWTEAFEKTGIDPEFYYLRERDEDEVFPWDFIDAGESKSHLLSEWRKAKEGVITGNCRQICSGCGCMVYGGGVCFENSDKIH